MLKNHLTISKAGTMLDARVSRRKFLELMGAGATVLVLGKILDYTSLFKSNSRVASSLLSPSGLLPEASAQSAGSWALGPPSSITPIHMAMLQTGRILILAGSGYHASNTTGPYQASLLD